MVNLLLYTIAYILVATLAPIGIIYGIIRKPKNLGRKLYDMAVILDKFGNVVMKEMFNDLLGVGFGDEEETISRVLGENKGDGLLKPMGKLLAYILNNIDPNHVEDAASE